MDDVEVQPQIALRDGNRRSPVDTVVMPAMPNTIKHTTTRKNKTCGLSMFLMAVVALGLFFITFSRSSLQSVDDEISLLLSSREQSDKTVQGLEKDIRALHRELWDLTDLLQQQGDPSKSVRKGGNGAEKTGEVDEFSSLQKKVKLLSASADQLKAQVQEVSRKEAEQKYGSGLHRVKIELEFPSGETEGPDSFVIELAPMDLMPHSVHFFLDMVSAGLLDGCSFILNALHVVKAAPLPYDGSSAAEKARSFTKFGLESVAFKEYSDRYPHTLYTVGFAADGSPSFYINTEDNSEIHMGDPCFGKIVSGFDAVKRLEQSPTKNGIWFEQRIGIKHAFLLSDHSNQQ